MQEKKCADKVQGSFEGRMEDLHSLYKAEDHETEELGHLYDYGLCIDRVEAGTFDGQRAPYRRYQLSWGGPADEFRLYDNGEMEYWFLDWGDGACVTVTGDDYDTVADIIEMACPLGE